ncbi:MAG: hypothetical protein U1F76_31055 [Candidatus Competibacteraceae bacterium]
MLRFDHPTTYHSITTQVITTRYRYAKIILLAGMGHHLHGHVVLARKAALLGADPRRLAALRVCRPRLWQKQPLSDHKS